MAEYIVEMKNKNDPNPKVVHELVRCKDCVYWIELYTPTCDFCSLDKVGRGAGYYCYCGIKRKKSRSRSK